MINSINIGGMFYDSGLVLLSYLVAVIVSYTALSLRAPLRESTHPYAWTSGSALSLGSGIWAMHFIGMLGDREICLAQGMDDYICNPINKDELTSLIVS